MGGTGADVGDRGGAWLGWGLALRMWMEEGMAETGARPSAIVAILRFVCPGF